MTGRRVRRGGPRCRAFPRRTIAILIGLLFRHHTVSVGEVRGRTIASREAAEAMEGLADPLVLPSVQRQFVQGLCDIDQTVDYREYDGSATSTPALPRPKTWRAGWQNASMAPPRSTC